MDPIQISDNVLFILGRNKSSFPYCNTYIIKEQKEIVVIDPNCGHSNLRRGLAAWGHDLDDITAILNTHFHVDHSSHSRRLAIRYAIPVYMHRLDAEAITSWDDLYVRYNIDTPWLKTFFHRMFATVAGFQPFDVSNPFESGDRLPADIRIVHTAGHTPGHCGFQYKDLLFSGDVELNMPWVGNMHANVSAFQDSIQWLSRQSYRMLLPGHGTPCGHEPQAALKRYLQKINDFEEMVYNTLSDEPMSVAAVARASKGLIPRRTLKVFDEQKDPLPLHFTKMACYQYLVSLEGKGRVRRVAGPRGASLWAWMV